MRQEDVPPKIWARKPMKQPSERKSENETADIVAFVVAGAAPLQAKPKVDVRVKVTESIELNTPQASLSRDHNQSPTNTFYAEVYFLNVTVLSENAGAVAKNNGQWCISGDIDLDKSIEYHGTLNGNTLEIELPQNSGKMMKKTFEITDHKWKKLSELAH